MWDGAQSKRDLREWQDWRRLKVFGTSSHAPLARPARLARMGKCTNA